MSAKLEPRIHRRRPRSTPPPQRTYCSFKSTCRTYSHVPLNMCRQGVCVRIAVVANYRLLKLETGIQVFPKSLFQVGQGVIAEVSSSRMRECGPNVMRSAFPSAKALLPVSRV